jgi:hypothetical protein
MGVHRPRPRLTSSPDLASSCLCSMDGQAGGGIERHVERASIVLDAERFRFHIDMRTTPEPKSRRRGRVGSWEAVRVRFPTSGETNSNSDRADAAGWQRGSGAIRFSSRS